MSVLKNWSNGILSYGIERPLELYSYSNYPTTENEDNFIKLTNVYSKCAVNIVTETQYDSRPGIITEKTFLAFLSRQIPIVIGYPGIVQDCIDLGFDMFTDLVDTSYDYAPNDCRVEQALQSNKDLILGKIDLVAYQDRLEQQQNYVLMQYTEKQEQEFIQKVDYLAKILLN
jgi:hypothetical protein